MKKIIPFLLILIFLSAHAKNEELSNLYEYQLPNGLKLIVKEDHSFYKVVVHTCYKVGSIYESTGTTGVSHALEHMMFSGTKKHGPGVLSEIFYKKGINPNARTSKDYTIYYEKILPEHLSTIFELEADRMQNLLLDGELFAREKLVIIEERKSRTDDNPYFFALEQFFGTAFTSNPYRSPVIGWMHDIENLDIDDLGRWYRNYYMPNNAVIVVVGNVVHENVYELVKEYFGDIPQGELPKHKPQKEIEHSGLREVVINKDIGVPKLLMAYNVPTLKNVDEEWKAYALVVLAYLLGEGDSSRLQKNLVRSSEVAVKVHVDYKIFAGLDNLFMFVGTPSSGRSLKELKSALLRQVELLKDNLISKEELEVVKIKLVSNHIYDKDFLEAQAIFITDLVAVGLPYQLAEDYLKHLESVTPEQIQKVVKEFFVENRLSIAKVLPIKIDQDNEGGNDLNQRKEQSLFPKHDEL